jgi:formate-dependent nitrite reductase membrane component NrfD
MQQHFVHPPDWGWYIVWYFFLGGIAGGTYVLGAILRLLRDERDEPVARIAFVSSFGAMVICPVLLTLDLGKPARFWHMLVDPTGPAVNFKPMSPMSVGVWILLGFGLFSSLSFVDVLGRRRLLGRGALSRALHVVGALFGLGLAGYTGVLLSVSNQPLWSDTWTLGGLFLASGLSIATVTLGLLAGWRGAESATMDKLRRAATWFLVLEVAWLVLFFLTLRGVALHSMRGGWLVLWLLVLLGILVPIVQLLRRSQARHGLAAGLVLVSGLALRIVVIFSAQA